MKVGPIYLLRLSNWLGLMREREAARRELELAREEVESLRHKAETLRGRIAAMEAERAGGPLPAVSRVDAGSGFNEPETPKPSKKAMMEAITGWTSRFLVDGEQIGGPLPMWADPLLDEQLALVGGVEGKRALELGPMDGAHTRILCERGVREVVAVEGFRGCWLRCLVTKEVFEMAQARFLYGDFCRYVADYDGPPFDLVLARGILYHQENPAALIHDLARITRTVVVWSQVVGEYQPGGPEVKVSAGGRDYRGRAHEYGGARNLYLNYCGGIHPMAVWMYPDELRRAFRDAGFVHLAERPTADSPVGPAVQFVASKDPLPR